MKRKWTQIITAVRSRIFRFKFSSSDPVVSSDAIPIRVYLSSLAAKTLPPVKSLGSTRESRHRELPAPPNCQHFFSQALLITRLVRFEGSGAMETLVLIFTGAFLLFIPPLATAALLVWVVDSVKPSPVKPIRTRVGQVEQVVRETLAPLGVEM